MQGKVVPPWEQGCKGRSRSADACSSSKLSYSPGPGLYMQLRMSQSACTTAEEMKEDMESYLVPYTSATPNYNSIQVTILNSVDWVGFLTILLDDPVVLVHSMGLFNSRLCHTTPAHSWLSGLVREKVGSELPPMVMAPVAGLVPWLRIQEQLQPDSADLAPLKSATAWTIQVPAAPLTEDDQCRISTSFQKPGSPITWLP